MQVKLPKNINTQTQGNVFCLNLSGDLDAHHVAQIREYIQNANGFDGMHIVVDLSDVGFVDSHGVGLFASLLKSAHSKGGILALSGVRDQPKSVLDLVGFNENLVKYFDTRDNAVTELRHKEKQ